MFGSNFLRNLTRTIYGTSEDQQNIDIQAALDLKADAAAIISPEEAEAVYDLRYIHDAATAGALVHGATAKDTPVDADEFSYWDSVASLLKKITWANLKAALQSVFDGRYSKDLNGRLFVPPAYMQTTGDLAFQMNSAAKGVAFRFSVPADYALDSFSLFNTAVGTEGNINCTLNAVNFTGAYEPNGRYNGDITDLAPTMTTDALPSPYVCSLTDAAGLNAEVAGQEAFKAYDGSLAADNGVRSNALPTGIAPMYLCLDLGSGNSIRLNKFRLGSYNNASADVRAFWKAFTVWGSNVASPTKNTDGDWTQLTGDAAWTAEVDPGPGFENEYYLNNAMAYRWIRFTITDRTGVSAYCAMGSIKLYGAQLAWSPGTQIYDITTLGSGAAADVWLRKALAAAQQLQRGTEYCLTFFGTAAKDFSLSLRRWNTSAGSMFPDGCSTKTTSDTGTTWTQAEQNSKPALLNIILNSTTNHCPKLHYGRTRGQYDYIPGIGIVTIPQAGISLNCEALTATSLTVAPSLATIYNVDLAVSGGNPVLTSYTTATTTSEGIEQGTASQRFLGRMCVVNRISTYQGPIDVSDVRALALRGVRQKFGKLCPYSSDTSFYPTKIWQRWGLTNDYQIFALFFEDETVELRGSMWSIVPSGAYVSTATGIDGCLPSPMSARDYGNNVAGGAMVTVKYENRIAQGFHSFIPLCRSSPTVATTSLSFLRSIDAYGNQVTSFEGWIR
jgi:hypothetical protein